MPVEELMGPMNRAWDCRTPSPRAKMAPPASATYRALRVCWVIVAFRPRGCWLAGYLRVASHAGYPIHLRNASDPALHLPGGLRATSRGRPLDAAHRARPAARARHLRQACRLGRRHPDQHPRRSPAPDGGARADRVEALPAAPGALHLFADRQG